MNKTFFALLVAGMIGLIVAGILVLIQMYSVTPGSNSPPCVVIQFSVPGESPLCAIHCSWTGVKSDVLSVPCSWFGKTLSMTGGER